MKIFVKNHEKVRMEAVVWLMVGDLRARFLLVFVLPRGWATWYVEKFKVTNFSDHKVLIGVCHYEKSL